MLSYNQFRDHVHSSTLKHIKVHACDNNINSGCHVPRYNTCYYMHVANPIDPICLASCSTLYLYGHLRHF